MALVAACRGNAPDVPTPPRTSPQQKPAAPVLGAVGGQELTGADLPDTVRARLDDMAMERFAVLRREAAALIEQRVVARAAAEAGTEPGAFLRREIESKAGEPTADDVAAALAAPETAVVLERMLAGVEASVRPAAAVPAAAKPPDVATKTEPASPLPDPREVEQRRAAIRGDFEKRVTESLKRERQARARAELITNWSQKFGARLTLPLPEVARVTVPADGFVRVAGSEAATSRVHLYLAPDLMPSRRLVENVMPSLARRPATAVFIAYLPAGSSPDGQRFAEGLQCAVDQGKGSELHGALFDAKSPPAVDRLSAIASAAGLDMTRFGECLTQGATRARVLALREAARTVGVKQAPEAFVNGVRTPVRDPELVEAVLDATEAGKV